LKRGFCFKCGKEIGGLFKPPAWRCSVCQHLYCERCAKDRVGLLFKKPACPECRIELRGG
jgi:hypothetical protein